jgi:hypothetical protein
VTEIQRYSVLASHPGFELRDYEPHTIVTKPMAGSMGAAGSNAFRYLAGYIGGQNQASKQIAMTAPVLQQKSEGGYDISFVMPHTLSDTPEPMYRDMRVTKMPGGIFAAKRFSGSASDALFERKAEKLLADVAKAGLRASGAVQYARYNGPWTPPPLRRNEVLVAIAS